VYFSFETVKSEREQMSFWAPMQVREKVSENVTPMQTFQRELRDAWYSFVETHFGKKVRRFDIE
jgi:tRNA G26 N,N-dimethylase Trm1